MSKPFHNLSTQSHKNGKFALLATTLGCFLFIAAGALWAQGGELRALPASENPPPEAQELERIDKEKLPAAPARTPAAELLEKIRKQPGGEAKVDAIRKGVVPDLQKRPTGRLDSGFLDSLSTLLIPRAEAQLLTGTTSSSTTLTTTTSTTSSTAFSLELTPLANSNGQHSGFYSSSPNGYLHAYGATINYSYPRNDYFYLASYQNGAVKSTSSNPYLYLRVYIPASGWYVVNANSLSYGNVILQHYENSSYPVLANWSKQSGWFDYSTAQYLTQGYHYFYFVFQGGGYISRVTVDAVKV